jgi:hypothetical protein
VRVWARTQSVESFVNDPNVRFLRSPIGDSPEGKHIYARSTEHLEEKLKVDHAKEYDSLYACAPVEYCHLHPLCNANGQCSFPTPNPTDREDPNITDTGRILTSLM